MIVDHISHWRRYGLGEAWDKAFGFLESLSADAGEKMYPIDGDGLFGRVMSYETKEEGAPDAVLEAHRRFADIQMVLEGAERIAVYPARELEIREPHDAQRDVAFFHYRAPARWQVGLASGDFAFLLPQDAHMPQLRAGAAGRVKKVVVKVAMDRLALR